jgi:hypothetical protein
MKNNLIENLVIILLTGVLSITIYPMSSSFGFLVNIFVLLVILFFAIYFLEKFHKEESIKMMTPSGFKILMSIVIDAFISGLIALLGVILLDKEILQGMIFFYLSTSYFLLRNITGYSIGGKIFKLHVNLDKSKRIKKIKVLLSNLWLILPIMIGIGTSTRGMFKDLALFNTILNLIGFLVAIDIISLFFHSEKKKVSERILGIQYFQYDA